MSIDHGGPDEAHQQALCAVLGFYRFCRRLKQSSVYRDLPLDALSTLSAVAMSEPVTISALSSAESVTTPTVSRAVAALEARGLVRCVPNRDDGRSVFVVSTAKGRALLDKGLIRSIEKAAALLSDLQDSELRAMSAAIQRVLDEAPVRDA